MMSVALQSALKDFFIYSFGSIITQVSNILLILFLMHHLPPDQVGLFSLAAFYTLMLSTLLSGGLRQLFMRDFFGLDARRKKEFFNDILMIYGALSAFFFLVLGVVHALFPLSFFYQLIVLQAFLTFFTEIFYQVLMYTLQSFRVAAIKTLSSLMLVGATIGSLTFLDGTVYDVLGLQCAILAAISCYAAWLYCRKKIYRLSKPGRILQQSRVVLKESLPLMPTVLAGMFLASGNRLLLARYATLAAVGVYAVAEYVSPLFNMLILYPLSGAYLPRIMHAFQNNEKGPFYVEASNQTMMWVSMGTLGMAGIAGYLVFTPLIGPWLPAVYQEALPGALAIFIGNIFLMGTYFTSSFIIFRKKNHYLLYAMGFAALANVVLACMLVPYWCITGCFISFVVSYFLYFFAVYGANRVVVNELKKAENRANVSSFSGDFRQKCS